MNKTILKINPNCKKIDSSYFNNYGGDNYSETYLSYTYHPSIVITDLLLNDVVVKNLLDVGCASGQLVSDFRSYGIEAFGIDNNRDILARSVCPKYTQYGDLRDLSIFEDSSFDVIYANSLMYLMPQEVLPVLRELYRICANAVFLCNPFLGETKMSSDPYRTFLAKPLWWEKQFQEAGFKKGSKNVYTKNN